MIELCHLPLLFLTGIAAGFVDAIAGGGGLITLPVLLGIGIDPKLALGTNKLQASFGSTSAAWHYARARTVDASNCWRGFVFTVIGAAAGTVLVQQLDPNFLRKFIPAILFAVALYAMLKPRVGAEDAQARMGRVLFDLIFGLALGFYDGFIGPGTGMFWTMAFMLALGFNMTKATGYTKVMNSGSNLSSLAVFIIAGQVLFMAGIAMGLGQLLGARIGARMVVARGTKFIRPIYISTVLIVTLKLLYDGYFRHVGR